MFSEKSNSPWKYSVSGCIIICRTYQTLSINSRVRRIYFDCNLQQIISDRRSVINLHMVCFQSKFIAKFANVNVLILNIEVIEILPLYATCMCKYCVLMFLE